ncbi:transposase-like protein [Streptomyces sp. V4I8]
MKTIKDQVAAEATIAGQEWAAALGAATDQIADCFERREPRSVAREMTQAVLMELDTRNCWTLAEALGHCGPHRLQHFLSRAAVDHDLARDRIAAWTAGELAGPEAVLIVDETGDAKSSTDCVGAAHQYSGALGGVGLCQVAVHLTFAAYRGHAIIDRALYLPAAWAEDEERRLLRHVPDEIAFATKPQLAAAMLDPPPEWWTPSISPGEGLAGGSLMVMKVYSPEFKADAVALYHSDPDLTIVQAARDLGINPETLRNWIRADRARADSPTKNTKDTPVSKATKEELEAELAALRKENAALRKDNATLATERDILRKATKFFAAEMSW